LWVEPWFVRRPSEVVCSGAGRKYVGLIYNVVSKILLNVEGCFASALVLREMKTYRFTDKMGLAYPRALSVW
jgi:hypothetical protein